MIASGGVYERAGRAHHDVLTPYLRHVLGWIGLHDVRFVRAEGVLASAEDALRGGREQLDYVRIGADPPATAAA